MSNITKKKNNFIKFLGVSLMILLFGSYISISAIDNPYQAGETLDPNCAPGEVNCTVLINGVSVDTALLSVYTDLLGSPSQLHSVFLGYQAGFGTDFSGGGGGDVGSNFLGYQAGYEATYSTDSNFLGTYAGSSADNASKSNFIGYGTGVNASNSNDSNFIGTEAGANAFNASYSNFIGYQSGNHATLAHYSNFIGYQSGISAGIASNSNFIGSFSGYEADFAQNSIFIGQESGYQDTVDNTSNGLSSVLIGSYTNTGGFSNSILLGSGISGSPISNTKENQFMLAPSITELRWRGVDYTLPSSQGGVGTVLKNDGSGGLTWGTDNTGGGGGLSSDADFNTVGGTNAGLNLVTGAQNNTFLGYEAGKSASSGGTNMADNNTAIGRQALYSNTTGRENTVLGSVSLFSNTTGSYNITTGNRSLYSNTTGSYNVANGYNSLYLNTSGEYNVAIGNQTLYSNTTGSQNTALGFSSLYSNTTGITNTAQGYYSLRFNTTGSNNTVLGHSSMYSNTTGHHNTAIGANSLYFNTIGYFNTVSGFDSAYYLGTSDESNSKNSLYGHQSGKYLANGSSPFTTATNSLYLGADTKGSANGVTNEIVVGYNAVGRGSNTAQWGNTSMTNHYLSGNIQFSTYGAGSLSTDASGNITASSDERLKNIQDTLFDYGLNEVLQINPILYTWKEETGFDTENTYAGFSAQNIQSVIPEAVGIDPKGYLTLSDRPILATVVKAIQELDLKVESLDVSSVESKGTLVAWFGDIANDISEFIADTIRARNMLCIGEGEDEVCITKEELLQIKNNADIVEELDSQLGGEGVEDEGTEESSQENGGTEGTGKEESGAVSGDEESTTEEESTTGEGTTGEENKDTPDDAVDGGSGVDDSASGSGQEQSTGETGSETASQ